MNVTDLISRLPKTDLHLHLIGSASVDTVLELAKRHPDRGVPTDRQALSDFYAFRDFSHFIEVYSVVDALVTTADDVKPWSSARPGTRRRALCGGRRSRSPPTPT